MLNEINNGVKWLSLLHGTEIATQFVLKLILALILTPNDFGVVGSAFILIGFTQTLTQTGVSAALVQKGGNLEGYQNTAWSAEIIRGALLYAIIYFAAPIYIKQMLGSNNADYVDVIRAIGLTVFIDSAKNISVILFEKNMHFKGIFYIQAVGLALKMFVTLLLSFYLRNYWGIVLGLLASSVGVFVMSYFVTEDRPKFSVEFDKLLKLLKFGGWVFGYTVIGYLTLRLGDIYATRFGGTKGLGLFQMAFFMGMIFRNSISEIQNRIFFPLLSRYQEDQKFIAETYAKIFESSLFIYFPAGIGLALISDKLVSVMFDEKWSSISTILAILAVAGFFEAMTRVIEQIYKAIGQPKYILILSVISLGVTIFLIEIIFAHSLVGISYSILVASILRFSIALLFSFALTDAREHFSSKNIAFIIVGVFIMSFFVANTESLFAAGKLLNLVSMIFCGIMTYGAYNYVALTFFDSKFVKRQLSYVIPKSKFVQ